MLDDNISSSPYGERQGLIVSTDEIGKYIGALFRYCEEGELQLRMFRDKPLTGTWGQPWRRVGVTDIHSAIIVAGAEAQRAADAAEKVVIAPPTATFKPGFSATEADICEGPCLSIEVDRASPSMARIKLAEVLGQPTVVVHSGGVYVGPNGAEDRLHLHWRLKEPTRTQEDHATLKECRRLATLIAQGDGSAVPLVHPLRLAGSWHRKDQPRLVWGEYAADREIELNDALELLRAAAPAEIKTEAPHRPSQNQTQAELSDIVSAVMQLENHDLDWNEWKRIVMAIWSATGGSPAGLAAAMAFSAKSSKDSPSGTMAAWAEIAGCPPDRIGVGTLFKLAKDANPRWLRPSIQAERDRAWAEQARDWKGTADADETRDSEPAPTLDPTQALIDELARCELGEFYKRLPDAAKQLNWREAIVESCVREKRRQYKAAGKEQNARAQAERKAAKQAEKEAEREQKKAAAEKAKAGGLSLAIGSDVDIADRLITDMLEQGLYVYSEGSFYLWNCRVWQALRDSEIQSDFMLRYDGASYGESSRIRLNEGRVKSIFKFVRDRMFIDQFFGSRPLGINVTNGFVAFTEDGDYRLVPHSEDQLSRHILAGAYEAGFDGLPADSLLAKFLDTMFQDDPEKEVKIKLLQEVAGSALMGAGAWLPQPKAVVLYGRSANNGKSEYLTLIEGLANGASHIPAHQFDQEKLVIGLRGQLLNVANELTSAHAIASETFKSAITGETVLGRQLYKDVVEFKPQAQHVYACNRLPPFVGGIDRGCKRRLLVLEFIKSIPTADMIPNIAQKILDSEYSLLLNWAIAGASRRIAQKDFTIPDSSADTLEEWVRDTDSVRAWVRDRVKLDEKERPSWPGYKPSDAMDQFYMWAVERHYDKYRLPKLSEFTQRMIEMFPSCKRTKDSSRFRGITILSSDQLDETANQSDPRKPSATSRFADWLTAGDEEVAASGHGSQGNGVEG